LAAAAVIYFFMAAFSLKLAKNVAAGLQICGAYGGFWRLGLK
jgi:hypothetical protein